MTNLTDTNLTSPDVTAEPAPLLRRLAAAAFFTTPLLMFGGMVTSPPQDGDSEAAYLASLARDWDLSILSANLLRYYWVLLALAVPAVLTLLRGNRGRTLTSIGVVATTLGAIQMSGVLFADWFNAAMPGIIGLDQSVVIFQRVQSDLSMSVWLQSGIVLGVLMPAVLLAGLARNGVEGWWTAPLAVMPMILGPIVGGVAGAVVGSVVGALCCTPFVLVGLRLWQRATPSLLAAAPAAAGASAPTGTSAPATSSASAH
jgi:hypothetical protein